MFRGFVEYVILLSLLAAFVITLMEKWKILEWLQVHSNTFFNKMFSCRFCLGFWVAMVICILVAAISGKWVLLAAPIFSCNITKWVC